MCYVHKPFHNSKNSPGQYTPDNPENIGYFEAQQFLTFMYILVHGFPTGTDHVSAIHLTGRSSQSIRNKPRVY